MKIKLFPALAVSLLTGACAWALPAAGAQQATPSKNPALPAAPAPSDPAQARAEIYYDYTMGHLYSQEYLNSNDTQDATRAIDFYKRANALDPGSQTISEELAEMYFVSQRIQEAVDGAREVLRQDPDNLAARRLLARIYIRSLGETRETADQQSMMQLAIEQLNEICRRDPTDEDSALWLARLDRLADHQDQAEQVLRALLARDPENDGALDQLTQLMLDENKPDAAVALLGKALEQTPSATLYDRLASAYEQKHDAASAEQAYRHASELDPTQPAHLHGLAQALADQSKYAEAAAIYEKLEGMEPNEVSNYLRLSEIYGQLHQLDKAEQQAVAAQQRAPDDLEVIYNAAVVYEAEGRYEDAVRVLSDAVAAVKAQTAVTPARRRTLAVLYQLLGQIYRDEENYSAAVNTFRTLAELGPEEDQRARTLIVDAYRASHDLNHAFAEVQKGLADYPQDRNLKISQATLYSDNKQPDQAVQVLRPLLNNSSADLEIELILGQIYAQGQRFNDAEQAVGLAQNLSQQPSDREAIGLLQGDIYARQKKYDQAEKSFQDVLAINPSNSAVLNYYGYLLADRGERLDESVSMLQRALAEEPNNSAYLDSLGWAYYKQDKLPEAEMYIRKALAHEAHDPTMRSHLGDVLAKSGRTDEAAAEWEQALADWRSALPAEYEAAKVTELEQKIANLRNHLAQQKPPMASVSQ